MQYRNITFQKKKKTNPCFGPRLLLVMKAKQERSVIWLFLKVPLYE